MNKNVKALIFASIFCLSSCNLGAGSSTNNTSKIPESGDEMAMIVSVVEHHINQRLPQKRAPLMLDSESQSSYYYASYPFDHMQIEWAYQFELTSMVHPNITAVAGEPPHNVYIAQFSTYVATEVGGEQQLTPVIGGETVVVIKGTLGAYAILLNNLLRINDDGYKYGFSSVKIFRNGEIIKDFSQAGGGIGIYIPIDEITPIAIAYYEENNLNPNAPPLEEWPTVDRANVFYTNEIEMYNIADFSII